MSYCGDIHLHLGLDLDERLTIYMPVNHVSQLHFLVFILNRTFLKCGPSQVRVIDNSTAHVYCGIRLPWNMLSTGRKSDIIITIVPDSKSTVTLFYKAVLTPNIQTVTAVSDWALLNKSVYDNYFEKKFAHSIAFCVSFDRIIISEIILKEAIVFDVFDGPGKRSNTIHLRMDPSQPGLHIAQTTAFNIYIMIHEVNMIKNNTYILKLHSSTSNMQHCEYRYNQVKFIVYLL